MSAAGGPCQWRAFRSVDRGVFQECGISQIELCTVKAEIIAINICTLMLHLHGQFRVFWGFHFILFNVWGLGLLVHVSREAYSSPLDLQYRAIPE